MRREKAKVPVTLHDLGRELRQRRLSAPSWDCGKHRLELLKLLDVIIGISLLLRELADVRGIAAHGLRATKPRVRRFRPPASRLVVVGVATLASGCKSSSRPGRSDAADA